MTTYQGGSDRTNAGRLRFTSSLAISVASCCSLNEAAMMTKLSVAGSCPTRGDDPPLATPGFGAAGTGAEVDVRGGEDDGGTRVAAGLAGDSGCPTERDRTTQTPIRTTAIVAAVTAMGTGLSLNGGVGAAGTSMFNRGAAAALSALPLGRARFSKAA